jgi:phosphatidylglycerol:prolipoprotein diacylglycerol transferase
MHAICLKLGPLTIHWYGVFMALGFLAGLANWAVLGRREGKTFALCSDLLFWIMVSGILGARLAYVIANIGDFADRPLSVFFLHEGGLIYYGGFIGAAVAIPIFAHVRGLGTLDTYDFVVTSVPLAHAFGRIGCFMNGCCFGMLYSGWPSVRFPSGTLPWWTHVESHGLDRAAACSWPVHPVQLYESLFNVLLFAWLVGIHRRRRRPGMTTAAYLLTYPVGRFVLETVRGDGRLTFGPLSVAQWLSVGLVLTGLAFAWAARRARTVPS